MDTKPTLTIDGRVIAIEGERNVLEIARKAGIDIPTFCYHSELSIYGACRLCLVEIEGRGIQTSCSTKPEAGMVIHTHTTEIRKMRKIALELLLANHEQNCPSCPKNTTCRLQEIAKKVGVTEVRYKPTAPKQKIDDSSLSILRDPNKCILCGDCVRACREIQGVGVLDFAGRGATSCVLPAFGKDLAKVECVNCGLCASVCPTGALTPKSEIEAVWQDIENPQKKVVVQIAPAVRVAIGEAFGLPAGSVEIGRMVAALKMLGFDQVYDTSFAADMTILEEAEEFISRKLKGEKLPQFTSCCPAWVKYAEQFAPDMLDLLSSCKSPQQMFGSVAKKMLPELLGCKKEDLVVVSLMPCTAKKFEAKRPEFKDENSLPDVDHVLTTQELARMIDEAGIRFADLEPQSLDMPLGFKTGAGVIFGVTGGVTEAALRYAVEKLKGVKLTNVDFQEVRGLEGVREAEFDIDGTKISIAILHSLKNAGAIIQQIRDGKCKYDLIEVMACPGGCISGAGQPILRDLLDKKERAKGLYAADKMVQLHKSQDNHILKECYDKYMNGEIGGHVAHQLLHTTYHNRRRILGETVHLFGEGDQKRLAVSVCVGTSCFIRGSQTLLRQIVDFVDGEGLSDKVEVEATFCFEKCDRGPTVQVGEVTIEKCTLEMAKQAIQAQLATLK
ncbi:MAG: [FeFe] hydrogenase, group A [Thermoguttaceae bacterium]|nr:[FeFe] hydrogenase, group A [Thermoguttaceae bacterium]